VAATRAGTSSERVSSLPLEHVYNAPLDAEEASHEEQQSDKETCEGWALESAMGDGARGGMDGL
jgi:hypothetical protein